MTTSPTNQSSILSVRNLQTHFATDDGLVRAVDGISFDLARGETLGIVGESGSGKSVAMLSLLRLIPMPPGRIAGGAARFDGKDLLALSEKELRAVRGRRIAMVFQDPMTSLNPFMRIGAQLTEGPRRHLGLSKREALKKAAAMLERVGIPDVDKRLDAYPHELSGGMRQRVTIAMALSCDPDILIADEPTTALDPTIQAQILDLLKELTATSGTAVVLITHDLGVVAGMADRVAVMYAGRIVEYAATDELFSNPAHPYTRGLLKSVPDLNSEPDELYQIPGLPPDLARLPAGCPFAPRCEHVTDRCRIEYPNEIRIGDRHGAACWLHEPL